MRRNASFCLARLNREGVHCQENQAYRSRLELGLVVSLIICTLVFLASRRTHRSLAFPEYVVGEALTALDLPPVTRSGGMPRIPTLPQVPMPSEDEQIPEEETIELTDLDLSFGMPTLEGLGLGEAGSVGGGGIPRPLRLALPEYPEALRKSGVEGVVVLSMRINGRGQVDSVYVMENSSGNRRLAQSAVEAARKTLYMPAKPGENRRSLWITRPYTFEGK